MCTHTSKIENTRTKDNTELVTLDVYLAKIIIMNFARCRLEEAYSKVSVQLELEAVRRHACLQTAGA